MKDPERPRLRIYTRYAKEFKLEAVRLLKLGQKPPIKGIGIELILSFPLALQFR